MIIQLLKALCILSMVLTQYGIVILNLNQYGIFQKFIELEFIDVHSKKESMEALHNISITRDEWGFPPHSK